MQGTANATQHLELIVSFAKGREGNHCLVILAVLCHGLLSDAACFS